MQIFYKGLHQWAKTIFFPKVAQVWSNTRKKVKLGCHLFWLRQGAQGVTLSVRVSVCLSGTSLSKAMNLHLSLIGKSQVSLRSVQGQS